MDFSLTPEFEQLLRFHMTRALEEAIEDVAITPDMLKSGVVTHFHRPTRGGTILFRDQNVSFKIMDMHVPVFVDGRMTFRRAHDGERRRSYFFLSSRPDVYFVLSDDTNRGLRCLLWYLVRDFDAAILAHRSRRISSDR